MVYLPMSAVAEILVSAADWIADHRWCRSGWAADSLGDLVFVASPDAVAWSMTGAIMRVTQIDPMATVHGNYFVIEARNATLDYLTDFLGVNYDEYAERVSSKEEAVATLRTAAASTSGASALRWWQKKPGPEGLHGFFAA